METAQKKRIIKRFLAEISPGPVVINDELLPAYISLDQILALIERKASDVIDFKQLEESPVQWNHLKDIINHSVEFSKNSNPPVLISFQTKDLLERIEFWRRDQRIAQLPSLDYYMRPTIQQNDSHLEKLKEEARKILTPLINLFLPSHSPINEKNTVQNLSKELESRAEKGLSEQEQHLLLLLNDLNKINNLTKINIPNEQGGSLEYCQLSEKVGGVTEKISLISMAEVKKRLGDLIAASPTAADHYLNMRSGYSLQAQAIIKLPKHGKIEEVQHEAMALNISRLLNLDTTESVSIMHEGKPALFVPFDDIKLMRDFARGKTFNAFASKQTYEHYSTINPVGAGLHQDEFIEDFGAALPLFYLCSDPDAMGGYNQNKALRNGKNLYVFDQVIMSSDKLALDSRMSLQPDDLILKHTRHGQGRNRSLIEDSSFDAKFEGIMALKDKQAYIVQLALKVVHQHSVKEAALNAQLKQKNLKPEIKKQLETEQKQVIALKKDAQNLVKVIKTRIEKIDKSLPKYEEDKISNNELKKSLIIEKLLHNPVLFTDEGRPYKNPWTNRHTNPIKTINVINNDEISLTFSAKFSPEVLAMIVRNSGVHVKNIDNKQLIIKRRDLALIHEKIIHPEAHSTYQINKDYLNIADLKAISMGYQDSNRKQVLEIIVNHQNLMLAAPTDNEKISLMRQTEAELHRYARNAEDKGFVTHVLKKLQFDNHHWLQAMIPMTKWTDQINTAFAAAAKLDRLHEFNLVLQEAILNKQLSTPNFRQFLKDCIELEKKASNYPLAQMASSDLLRSSQQIIQKLSYQKQYDEVENSSDGIDVIAIRLEELEEEIQLFATFKEEKPATNTILEKINEQAEVKIPNFGDS